MLEARNLYDGSVAPFPRERFLNFIKVLRIQSRDEGLIYFRMLGSQLYVLDEICRGLEDGITSFVILKARQLGITTFLLALDLFWAFEHAGLMGAFIMHDEAAREQFRNQIETFMDMLPASHRIDPKRSNSKMLVLRNGSYFRYLVAGIRAGSNNMGRSGSANYAHFCMAPGTPVVVEHGRIKAVEDIEIGDQVLTHNGHAATVIDVCGQRNTKGDLIKITPWLGEGVEYTDEHKIPTQRGMVAARDILKTDFLIMPVRSITDDVWFVTLPIDGVRYQNGGKKSKGAGKTIILNEEFGFFCGYYLAEGYITVQSTTGRASAVAFARHQKEKSYADRACNAVKNYVTRGKTQVKKGSLTAVDTVYSFPLASWIKETFGVTDGKIIPDYIFTWGDDFCRGLLAGILCGDGSKSTRAVYEAPTVVMPTTRSSLAMQTRDLAASLGFGWGSISFKDAGLHYGRNCKPCWRVTWSGQAARRLLPLMGIRAPKGGKPYIEKYKIENGLIYIKIRKIEHGFTHDMIWDISVDHEDHTFRTPSMSTSNTETAFYGSPENITAFTQSLAQRYPHRLCIHESTANGFNHYSEMWDNAKSSPAQRAIFVGWWRNELFEFGSTDPLFPKYMPQGVKTPLTPLEKRRIKAVKEQFGFEITAGQIAWYRHNLEINCNRDQSQADAEMPWTPEDAFVATGAAFFTNESLTDQMRAARRLSCQPFVFKLTKDWFDVAIVQTAITHCTLKIWEHPDPNGVYVMGCDPAEGGGDGADNTVISVFRCYADKLVQVAEYCSSSTATYQCAWIIAYLGGLYGNIKLILELNGPGGSVLPALKELKAEMARIPKGSENTDFRDCLSRMNDFLYSRQDSLGASYVLHWQSTYNTKSAAMYRLRDMIELGLIELRSMGALEEMRKTVIDDGNIAAFGRGKDDRVIAAALANWAWNNQIRPALIANGRTFEREQSRARTGAMNNPAQVMWNKFLKDKNIKVKDSA